MASLENFVFIFSLIQFIPVCYCVNEEFLLRNELFNETRYSSYVTPRKNVSETVQIVVRWEFVRLEGLYEKDAKLTQSVAVTLTWTDDFLTWDPSLYGGITHLTARGKQVWTPDFKIFNKVSSEFLQDGLEAELLTVKSDGTVTAQPSGVLNTICEVGTEKFPVDCHECSILAGSTAKGTKQTITWDTIMPTSGFDGLYGTHAFWSIEKVDNQQLGPLVVVLRMYLKRLPAHYIYNIVVPALALAVLSIFVFYIPIAEGERVGFGVTIFLSYMVLMLQVSSVLPEDSRNLSAVGKYFICLTCSSLVAIFNSVVMSYFEDKGSDNVVKPSKIFPEELEEDSSNNNVQSVSVETNTLQTKTIDDDKPMFQKDRRHAWNPRVIFALRMRQFFRPLRVFDWISLLVCFIIILQAHVELWMVIAEDTCASLY